MLHMNSDNFEMDTLCIHEVQAFEKTTVLSFIILNAKPFPTFYLQVMWTFLETDIIFITFLIWGSPDMQNCFNNLVIDRG